MLPVPPILMRWLAPFAAFFTKPTWERVLVLATGAVLAPGRRTVLSVLGRRDGTDFARFHGVLNRARWSCKCRVNTPQIGRMNIPQADATARFRSRRPGAAPGS